MKTIIILQCRLSSTRLPQKALYKLNDDVLLGWALKSMHQVKADDYFVACDFDSESELSPLVLKNNFKIFAGSKDDVLDRFCKLIEKENPDVVLRATADNPFLFYDAAQNLLDLYTSEYYDSVDYITFSGLPHGSGIEIFKASSLLKAKCLTDLDYDHEHVGPALYNHPENFKSLFIPAPEKYNYPYLRTTIDTYADYLRACDVIAALKEKNIASPYKSEDVINTLSDLSIARKILYVPSIKKGQGTGHLRRCVELAVKTKGALLIDADSYKKEELIDFEPFIKDLNKKRILNKLPLKNEYDLIVCDKFKMTKEESDRFTSLGKTVFIDEGSSYTDKADFLLDIIPSELKRSGNLSNPYFIPSPVNKKPEFPLTEQIRKVLVCFGGEDPSGLTNKVVSALNSSAFKEIVKQDLDITVVTKENPVKNLKEHLCEYDLVITHYGFTAYECLFANVPVLLCATSKLHEKLSLKNNFACIKINKITPENLAKYFVLKILLKNELNFASSKERNLSTYILNLSNAALYDCPVCKTGKKGSLVARTPHHTFRKCPDCKMVYISFSDDSESVKYEKSYFAEEYKKQYGKTYLEDFESIKKNCVSRVKSIDRVLKQKNGSEKNILDIGCAYGPFLSAASDDKWTPFGSDIAVDAIDYVKRELGFKATNASFADLNLVKEFGVEQLDAVTMWYVIEHIKDLKNTLRAVNKMLKTGGVFAFSTPNAAGISRKTNPQSFFENSPKDHYSLWELPQTQSYLKKFGFKVYKVTATGIHPERIPFVKKHKIGPDNFIFRLLISLMKIQKNGDTYEVYCKKINGITDEQ